VLYFSSFCALACCGLDRKVPVNYLLLSIFTLCVSWIVGCVCARYDQATVIEAAFLTTAVCAGIVLYAMTTKHDFTVCGPVMFILGLVFVTTGILLVFFPFHMRLIYCVLGVILFSFYLLFDIQIIMGGSHKRFSISEDSYILAAIAIYLDIINIFLYILEIMGGGD
jgi:protein lifeguard